MSAPLVYIDQNIIGLQLKEILNLQKIDDIVWVYSKEHFSEIRRSNEPDKFLEVLRDIDAKLLELVLNDQWQITGEAQLINDGDPFLHYENFITSSGEVDFDDSIFDPFQVWINGGGDEGPLKEVSDNIAKQILALTSELPFDTVEMTNRVNTIKPDFDSMIEEMVNNGNDIKKTRAVLGDEKGAIGSIQGERQIEKIWEMISPSMRSSEFNCDQFFGFDPIDKQG